jgi:hypothetical protein
MKAISLFNGEGIYSFETCVKLSTPFIKLGREFIKEHNIPKWFLAEIYCNLKKAGDLPKLPEERKREIWKESKHDKQLAYSLYLLEIL